MLLMDCNQSIASSEWIIYDDGEAVHAGSGMVYQGVRFSLADDVVRAPLLQVAFFYSTNDSFCPVRIHITDHSRSASLLEPIVHDAIQGWNYVDLSLFNISVPHNFYVILENSSCGFPMLDDGEAGERSFKGNHLRSMTTRLSHDLLIRTEIGEPSSIPVREEWNVSIGEKITVKHSGTPTLKIVNDSAGKWKLYSEGSFKEDNMLYGLFMQKGKNIRVDMDPEDVRNYIIEIISSNLTEQIANAVVTKVSFTGKSVVGIFKGNFKIYARIVFADNKIPGKITIERKFTGSTVKSAEAVSFAEY